MSGHSLMTMLVDIATIKNIVLSCPKQRFALKEEENKLYIRANQGHSLKNVQVDLEELTSSTIPEILIHGTYEQYWSSIKSQGLSRMTRQHIHLATGITGAAGTISGVRATCDIHVYVDGLRALTDGYKFFKSANNVILCPGDDRGFLPPSYFARVVNAKSGADVPLL
ncbi:tRNA 2'-phosphotransferase 1-like isoform X2 [Hyalella azteca]|uniref:tRNA 2'-phosphotransferase 1-like isoform X2 n=1 Tax=Hyalella azteca TaxID=294128 RepID=A0A8B7NVL9_HYAAZ|nr:tRNA 2'-phosphotransferase 1-like isoform X2 [Hyalella azteca]